MQHTHTHNGTHTQRDTYTTGHIHNGTHTQRDTYTTGHIHNGTHTQRDTYTQRDTSVNSIIGEVAMQSEHFQFLQFSSYSYLIPHILRHALIFSVNHKQRYKSTFHGRDGKRSFGKPFFGKRSFGITFFGKRSFGKPFFWETVVWETFFWETVVWETIFWETVVLG